MHFRTTALLLCWIQPSSTASFSACWRFYLVCPKCPLLSEPVTNMELRTYFSFTGVVVASLILILRHSDYNGSWQQTSGTPYHPKTAKFWNYIWKRVFNAIVTGLSNFGFSPEFSHTSELKGALPRIPRRVTANWLFLLCLYISFSVYRGLTLLLQMEWAPIEDSSKPNLKNEDLSGTAVQFCTQATIWCYFEAAEGTSVLIFFPEVASGLLRNITEPYF